MLAALVLMHLIALHDSAGSGNPLGVSGNYDRLPFAPYFIFKDLITIFIFILVLSLFVFFMPNLLGDSENYVMANPMQTPPAIVPEWYLLPFYAILRSIPNKLLGVIAMFSAILILLAMPFTDLSRLRGIQFRPLSKATFFIFVGNFLILMQLGAKHVESPFIEFGQISTVLYFSHFLIIVPLISLLENSLIELATDKKEDEFYYASRLRNGNYIVHAEKNVFPSQYIPATKEQEDEFYYLTCLPRGKKNLYINHVPETWRGHKFYGIVGLEGDTFYSFTNPENINISNSSFLICPISMIKIACAASTIFFTCAVLYIFSDSYLKFEHCDAPRPWGVYFQDSASPQMEGLVELHDNILFYLVIILFAVGWILVSIAKTYTNLESPVSHKNVSHGTISVPIRKCSKFKNSSSASPKSIVITTVRTYCSPAKQPAANNLSDKYYEDSSNLKKFILKENKGKSGIYMWNNKITGDIYTGQSSTLAAGFTKYFSLSYLKSKKNLIICRALIKYGHSNFSLTILEYCDISKLLDREQYYFDKLGPQYNILKIAGCSAGHTLSEETKAKISKDLKGVYLGNKSPWFGQFFAEESKKLMSLKKSGVNNPLFAKTHSEESKELMKQKALDRKHSEDTKLKMSSKHGNPVNIYEKCSSEGFKLIGSFVSVRRAGKFLGMSGSTVIRYLNSGAIFKYRYKFSSK